MERKRRIRSGWIMILWLIMISGIPVDVKAQSVTNLNDKAKTYQLRSMENGKWEFHPGWYYVTFHKKYSGGYWKGLNIKWDVNKSDVKQISPVRASEVELEHITANKVQNQIDTIRSLAQEETIRSAERIVDLIYPQYESKFKECLSAIDEMTTIINTKSNGAFLEEALAIIDEKDLLQAEIDYIHEIGPTKQMEQAKRQLAYEEVLKKLEKLCDTTYKLAYYAETLNRLKK